jgi:hypothetical protein
MFGYLDQSAELAYRRERLVSAFRGDTAKSIVLPRRQHRLLPRRRGRRG